MITRAVDLRPGDRIMGRDGELELVSDINEAQGWLRVSVVPRSPFDIGKDYYFSPETEVGVKT